MAEIVNLNKARKARARAEAARQAEENRVRFGRTRHERDTAATLVDKARRDLEAKRRED